MASIAFGDIWTDVQSFSENAACIPYEFKYFDGPGSSAAKINEKVIERSRYKARIGYSTFVLEKSYHSLNRDTGQLVPTILYNTAQHDEEDFCFGHISVMQHHWTGMSFHITLHKLTKSHRLV